MLQRHCFHTCQAAASAADSPGNAARGHRVLSVQKHIVVHHPGDCSYCGQAVPGIQRGRPEVWLQALGQRYFAGAGKNTCSRSYQSGLGKDVNRCISGVLTGTLAHTVPSNGPRSVSTPITKLRMHSRRKRLLGPDSQEAAERCYLRQRP